MKIVYFTDLVLFSIGGVSNSLLNLSICLKKKGHKITIFAPRSKDVNKKGFKGISLKFFPSLASSWNPRLRIVSPLSPSLFAAIKKIDPDIIHFHTPFLIGVTAVILGKSLKKPVIGTFHSYFMQPEYLKAAGFNVRTNSLTNFLWKYAAFFYNQCDAVIAPSGSVKKDLQKNGVKKPIYVVSNLINKDYFKLVNNKQLQTLKNRLQLSKRVILYVGRLSHEKSLDILIKSFSKVTKKMNNVSLLIIGDGQIKTELENLVKKLNIQQKVVFTGSIESKTLLSSGYFQLADAFVTASTSEVQPISLIEAVYFKLPLIGVSKRGTNDMVKNVGLLSPPNNINALAQNILRVLTNNTLRQQLSLNSKKAFLQKYSAEKIIVQITQLYHNLSRRA